MKKTWCCEWFENGVKHGKQACFSIVATDRDPLPGFWLRTQLHENSELEFFQKKDTSGESNWSKMIGDRVIPIKISSRIPLTYCPRCGMNLNKLRKKRPSEFQQLVTDSKYEFIDIIEQKIQERKQNKPQPKNSHVPVKRGEND